MASTYIECSEGTGKKVACHSFTEDSVIKYVERDQPGVGKVELPVSPQLDQVNATGNYPTNAIDCQGKWFIVIRNTFSTNTANGSFRFIFYDSNDMVIGYSEEISIANLAKSVSGRYFGDTIVYTNDFGATSFKIEIESITDNINMYIGMI